MAKGQRKSNREAKKPKKTAAERSKSAAILISQPGSGHLAPGSRQEGRKAPCLDRLRGENAGMDEQVLQLAEQLLATGFLKLSERERRVITGVAKRTHISRDVNRTFAKKQTLGDRLADRVASFGGSWTFIAMCLVPLIAWAAFNSVVRS